MDETTAKKIARRFDDLERYGGRVRFGEVTDASPLSVTLGAGEAYVGVATFAHYSPTPGDQVACLVWGKGNLDMLVLGEVSHP